LFSSLPHLFFLPPGDVDAVVFPFSRELFPAAAAVATRLREEVFYFYFFRVQAGMLGPASALLRLC
jgi:hypothetical protein